MKQRLLSIFATLALAALLFAGCAPVSVAPAAASPETDNPAPEIDGPVYVGTDIPDSPFVGVFENTYVALFASKAEDVFVVYTVKEDGSVITTPLHRKPTLECRSDGTFSITVNTLEDNVYATVNGSYTVDGEWAEFTVAAGEYGDFIGADTQKFSCRMLNANELRYWGDQIGSVTGGDVFKRQ